MPLPCAGFFIKNCRHAILLAMKPISSIAPLIGEPEIDILTTRHQIAASDCRWTSIKSDSGAGVDWKYPIGRLKVPDRW